MGRDGSSAPEAQNQADEILGPSEQARQRVNKRWQRRQNHETGQHDAGIPELPAPRSHTNGTA